MPTITTVDATWTNGVAMDEAELRRADSAMFLGDGSTLGVRGGIIRHGDNTLLVQVNGSDQLWVQAGAFVIPAATGLGVYRGAIPAATAALAIAPRNATNPRIDLVVIQSNGTVKTIEGTPGASPSAPGLPAQHIELARITVPPVAGGAVTVDHSWRQYAAAYGGTLYVETAARLPGSGNHKGQHAVALDTGYAYRWNGTTWWITEAQRISLTPSGGSGTLGVSLTGPSGTVDIDYTAFGPSGVAADATIATLPAGYLPSATTHHVLHNRSTGASWLMYVTPAGAVKTVDAVAGSVRISGTFTYHR